MFSKKKEIKIFSRKKYIVCIIKALIGSQVFPHQKAPDPDGFSTFSEN
jgi:hypothetical protein